jgi:hypothetical protein
LDQLLVHPARTCVHGSTFDAGDPGQAGPVQLAGQVLFPLGVALLMVSVPLL